MVTKVTNPDDWGVIRSLEEDTILCRKTNANDPGYGSMFISYRFSRRNEPSPRFSLPAGASLKCSSEAE